MKDLRMDIKDLVMTGLDLKSENTITNFIKLLNQGVALLMLGCVLYGLYVLVPRVAQMNIDAFSSLGIKFSQDLQKISDVQLETAKERVQALDNALEAFRKDEQEDRRLFVEILKRSDITPSELREAIDEATKPEGFDNGRLE